MHVRRHAVVLTALLAAPLAGCSDATPGALDSDASDYAAASAVWRDPWVAPTVAMAPGPGLGTDGWVTRVVGGRTTSYDVPVEPAATAELTAAAEAGWFPTSSACGGTLSVALAGPDGALATLVVSPSGGGSEVRVAALTPHHLDDDWSVPDAVDRTCLDGGPSDLVELPESSEPLRTAELPDAESVGWESDELTDDDVALREEVNADLESKEMAVIPPLGLNTGENWRRAPGTEASVVADGLTALGSTLEGWTLTWTACGGGAPDAGDVRPGPSTTDPRWPTRRWSAGARRCGSRCRSRRRRPTTRSPTSRRSPGRRAWARSTSSPSPARRRSSRPS